MHDNTALIMAKRTAGRTTLSLVPSMESQPKPHNELLSARVVAQEAEEFALELETGEACRARRAAGCMLLPEPGDLVLICHAPHSCSWVLQVLEKQSTTWRLECPGDMELSAPQGRCSLKGEELRLEGLHTTMRFLGLDLAGKNLVARIENVRTVAGAVTMLSRLCTATFGRLVRSSTFELNKSRHLRTEVEGHMATRCGKASLKAEGDVSIDGSSINLG